MPAYRFNSTRVYTNKPACGPKRGHGSVQPRFAFEVQLDKVAERIGMDPMELRRVNFMGSHTRTVNELRVTSNGFLECLEAVERASGWKERWRRLPFGRGLGVAGSCYISGTNYPVYPNDMPQSAIQIQIDRSGRVAVFSGASEIGQGVDSMVAYVAAEELGVPLEYVRVYAGDTDFTPVDLGAYSSRVTFMLGNACLDAARKLRRKVQEAVAELGVLPRRRSSWRGAGPLRPGHRPPDPHPGGLRPGGVEIRHPGGDGLVQHPEGHPRGVPGGDHRGLPAYSFTAHVAEVEVDPETGFVEVQRRSGWPTTAAGP
jgi:4-hydroxybenzoyl-CoA reductase subunit alpha